jgi:hypothetical protein
MTIIFAIIISKNTVKLGYNKLGYNEHMVITNKNICLVGLGHFYDKISGYNEQILVIFQINLTKIY